MRKFALVIVAGGTALLTVHGCGIDVVGIDPSPVGPIAPGADGSSSSTSGDDGAASSDATTSGDGSTDAPVAPACTCSIEAPDGWTLVAWAANRDTSCPSGFTTDDRVTNVTANAGACTCDCKLGTLPSCNKGTFSSKEDSSGTPTCNSDGTDRTTNDGNCMNASNVLKSHRRAVPPKPDTTPATCTAPGVAHQEEVQATNARVCGGGCACDPALGSKFTTCIRATGEKTCPTGFTQRNVIGTKGVIACGADCSCSVTNISCSGTITYYSAQNCPAGNVIEVIDDKTCSAEQGSSFSSYKWAGTTNATCTPGPAPAPTVSVEGAETVCCP